MGTFFCWGKLKFQLQDKMRHKNRIPTIYNMTYFIAEISIYFKFSSGKFHCCTLIYVFLSWVSLFIKCRKILWRNLHNSYKKQLRKSSGNVCMFRNFYTYSKFSSTHMVNWNILSFSVITIFAQRFVNFRKWKIFRLDIYLLVYMYT